MTKTDTIKNRTSRDIARSSGKRHDHVLRDVRKMVKEEGYKAFESSYLSASNQWRKMYILSDELADALEFRYKGRRIKFCARQDLALSVIEQTIGRKLVREFRVGPSYRVDGYDMITRTFYEIDESHHKHQTKADEKREQYIKDWMLENAGKKVTFVRIKI